MAKRHRSVVNNFALLPSLHSISPYSLPLRPPYSLLCGRRNPSVLPAFQAVEQPPVVPVVPVVPVYQRSNTPPATSSVQCSSSSVPAAPPAAASPPTAPFTSIPINPHLLFSPAKRPFPPPLPSSPPGSLSFALFLTPSPKPHSLALPSLVLTRAVSLRAASSCSTCSIRLCCCCAESCFLHSRRDPPQHLP
ncbi:hypothetical protein AOQ84DRAFT_22871 [Glonium stellatum]|uniref:Uncharacterized protein n=1 Tax=Glonium stellatum TaxID=574774 RepID=A0A8E2F341_9PEZI|nr:hypothetical protein AOQ84DRAFT_22871 [Glonium stellatum]